MMIVIVGCCDLVLCVIFYLLLFLLFVFCFVDVFHLGDHVEYDDINMFYIMPVCRHIPISLLIDNVYIFK